MPIEIESARRAREAGNPQQMTRIPPWRPRRWVMLKPDAPGDLAGKVRQVRSLTCSITDPNQGKAVWRVHFLDGRCCEVCHVARPATPEEAARAEARRVV